jgi:hypothetical protein
MIFLKIPAAPRQLNCARKGSADKKEKPKFSALQNLRPKKKLNPTLALLDSLFHSQRKSKNMKEEKTEFTLKQPWATRIGWPFFC